MADKYVQANLPMLSSGALSTFRKSLIESNSENPVSQRRFLEATVDKHSFLRVFNQLSCSGTLNVPIYQDDVRFTANEFSDPPISTEKQHYQMLNKLLPRHAASSAFWTSYHLELARRGILAPHYLAKKSGSGEEGKTRILRALKRRKSQNEIRSCVRNIFRRLGGLREVRGNFSLYTDCRLARAWWTGTIVSQVEQYFSIAPDDVWQTLRLGNEPWETFISYGLRRLTIISEKKVRAALVARLIHSNISSMSATQRKTSVEGLIRHIGVLSASKSLGFLTVEELLDQFKAWEV